MNQACPQRLMFRYSTSSCELIVDSICNRIDGVEELKKLMEHFVNRVSSFEKTFLVSPSMQSKDVAASIQLINSTATEYKDTSLAAFLDRHSIPHKLQTSQENNTSQPVLQCKEFNQTLESECVDVAVER
jgi:hypothetical protein